jgi:hypothetical protein
MSNDGETGHKLPVSTHASTGLTLNIGGIPIPLRRTFGAIDRLIAVPIEALADVVESKIKKNLDSHVDAVQKARKAKGKKEKLADPSVRTTRAIAEWATAAAEVDPDEEDASAVWRSVLDEILEGGDDAEDLLRIVKALPSSDIRFFIEAYARSPRPTLAMHDLFNFSGDDAILSRLKTYGLITKTFSPSLLFSFIGLTGGSLLFAYIAASNTMRWDNLPPTFQMTVAFGALIFAGALVMVFNLYRPTALGKHLCRLYAVYADRK